MGGLPGELSDEYKDGRLHQAVNDHAHDCFQSWVPAPCRMLRGPRMSQKGWELSSSTLSLNVGCGPKASSYAADFVEPVPGRRGSPDAWAMFAEPGPRPAPEWISDQPPGPDLPLQEPLVGKCCFPRTLTKLDWVFQKICRYANDDKNAPEDDMFMNIEKVVLILVSGVRELFSFRKSDTCAAQ